MHEALCVTWELIVCAAAAVAGLCCTSTVELWQVDPLLSPFIRNAHTRTAHRPGWHIEFVYLRCKAVDLKCKAATDEYIRSIPIIRAFRFQRWSTLRQRCRYYRHMTFGGLSHLCLPHNCLRVACILERAKMPCKLVAQFLSLSAFVSFGSIYAEAMMTDVSRIFWSHCDGC